MTKASSQSYRTILRSSLIMGASSVLNILTGLIKMKMVALLLGPVGVGLIGLYQNLMQSASTVSALGFGHVGTRQIAAAEATKSPAAAARARAALFWGTLALALAGAAIVWAARHVIARRLLDDAGQSDMVGWLALGVALTVLAGWQQALLSGMRRIGDLARLRVLSGIVAAVCGILAIWFWGLPGIVVPVLLVPATGVVLGYWYVSRLPPPAAAPPGWSDLIGEWRSMITLGTSFMLSAMVMMLAQLAVRSLIQHRLGGEALGQFQASWSIGMIYLSFILGAMATDYYPRLSGAITDRAAAIRLVNEQTEVALLLCGPVLLGMLALAPWVIRLLYSREFAPAADILHWQLLGDILKVLYWPLSFVLMAIGAGKTYIFTQAFGAAAFFAVTYLALPALGVTAAGLGFIALYAVVLPINLITTRYWTGFRWSAAVMRQSGLLIAAAVTISGLARVSDPLAAGVGVPLALVFAVVGLIRLSHMAGFGGKIGRLAAVSERLLQRARLIRRVRQS